MRVPEPYGPHKHVVVLAVFAERVKGVLWIQFWRFANIREGSKQLCKQLEAVLEESTGRCLGEPFAFNNSYITIENNQKLATKQVSSFWGYGLFLQEGV